MMARVRGCCRRGLPDIGAHERECPRKRHEQPTAALTLCDSASLRLTGNISQEHCPLALANDVNGSTFKDVGLVRALTFLGLKNLPLLFTR
jgi:hypothetical protein